MEEWRKQNQKFRELIQKARMQQADNDPAANEVTDNVLSFHYKLRVFGAIGTTVAETDPLVVTPLPRLSDDEPSTPTSNAPEIRDIVVNRTQTPLIEGEPILGLAILLSQ